MATYENNLRLKEITPGDEDGTWGISTNTNLALIADAFGYGTEALASDANATITMADAAADGIRAFVLEITSGVALTATRTVTLAPSNVSKIWAIKNSTSGGESIVVAQGSGSTVTIANGAVALVYTDGGGASAAVVDVLGDLPLSTFGLTATATELNYVDGVTSNIQTQLDGKAGVVSLTASRAVVTDGSGALAASDVTATEIGYLDGVTGAIQTQLDGKPANNGTGATGTWSISISGSAATVSNGVYTTGSYSNPSWITALAGSKISGNISGGAATLSTARTINGMSFNGSANITVPASVSSNNTNANRSLLMSVGTGGGNVAVHSTTQVYANTSSNIIFATDFDTSSDENFKAGWMPVAEDFVEQLAGAERFGIFTRTDTGMTTVGGGAQTIQRFCPEAVSTRTEEVEGEEVPRLGVNLSGFAAVAVHKLAQKVVELEARLHELEDR